MFRLFLVLAVCALPVCALASTYSKDSPTPDYLKMVKKSHLLFGPYKPKNSEKPAFDRRETLSGIWNLAKAEVFETTGKSLEFVPFLAQKPEPLRFENASFPPALQRVRPNRTLSSGTENIVTVPVASSYLFTLTLMLTALFAKQNEYTRSLRTYARRLTHFHRTRSL